MGHWRQCILRLLGLQQLPSMVGRPIDEAFRSGPLPTSVSVTTRQVRSAKANGYEVSAQVSTVSGHDYLDFTQVTRDAGASKR